MAHDVFISVSSKDKPTGDAVCAVLEAHKIRCWIAPRDIAPGVEWAESIIDAIGSARCMVLVFSEHANSSPQIRREVERAVHNAIAIIPLRIEDVQPSKTLEYFISTPHWLDAFDPPLERHLNRLAEAIQLLLDRDPRRDASVKPEAQAGGESFGHRLEVGKSPSPAAPGPQTGDVTGAPHVLADAPPPASTTPDDARAAAPAARRASGPDEPAHSSGEPPPLPDRTAEAPRQTSPQGAAGERNAGKTGRLAARAKNILFAPNSEWPVIATESTPTSVLYLNYMIPLAAIGPVAALIGLAFGGFASLPALAAVEFLIELGSVFIAALIFSKLAPRFGGRENLGQAMKLACYSSTPAWLSHIFNIIPVISILSWLVSLYGVYLVYTGATPVLGVPKERAAGFTTLTVIVASIIVLALSVLFGVIISLAISAK